MAVKRATSRIVVSDVNKTKRVEFAHWMLSNSDEYIDSICFSDETMFKSRPNEEVVLFRLPEDNYWYKPTNAGNAKSVMMWGCVSKAAYGPLVVIEGKNTAFQYIQTLENYLLPELRASADPLTFQQDNATIHKTPAV